MASDKRFKLPPKPKEGAIISVRLSHDCIQWLRKYAKKNERSIGTVARAMIEHMVKGLL